MACKKCPDGSWVCEPDSDDPSGACGMQVAALVYQGRYHLDGGKRRVWCRGSDISVSDCEPNVQNGGPWTLAGCADLDTGAWDLYMRPGDPPLIKIEQVATNCDPCTD